MKSYLFVVIPLTLEMRALMLVWMDVCQKVLKRMVKLRKIEIGVNKRKSIAEQVFSC
jgi:hypothetical protein